MGQDHPGLSGFDFFLCGNLTRAQMGKQLNCPNFCHKQLLPIPIQERKGREEGGTLKLAQEGSVSALSFPAGNGDGFAASESQIPN